MRFTANVLCAFILIDAAIVAAQIPPQLAKETNSPKVVRDEVKGSINHGRGNTIWKRIIGKVRVINATTLEFADGTKIDLDITVPAPGQMAMNGDQLYPCDQEAAVGERLKARGVAREILRFLFLGKLP